MPSCTPRLPGAQVAFRSATRQPARGQPVAPRRPLRTLSKDECTQDNVATCIAK
jgi:hypothetical protein